MIETILAGLLPVIFVILLGWLAGRTKLLKHKDAGVLATVVIRFALPFSLFAGAVNTSPDKLAAPGLGLCLLLGLMLSYAVALIAGLALFKHDLRTATMQALVCGYPDMAYFGAPILSSMFGPVGFLPVLLGNLVTSIVMLPTTIVLTRISEQGSDEGNGFSEIVRVLGRSIFSALLNPIVWLPILGVILSFSHVTLPKPLSASVDMIAKTAGGTSLFALGLMLYGEKFRINADVVTNIGIKNFLQPALMVLGAVVFGLTDSEAHQAIVTGAVPTATAASMFALRNKTYTADATSTILLSTVLGIFTEAVLIAVFSN